MTTAVDTFDRALKGARCVSCRRRVRASRAVAALRRRQGRASAGCRCSRPRTTADDPPLYAIGGRSGGNVHRALSLVPQAMMQFWDLFEAMYLPQDAMRDFGREYRAITHAQIEMLAARGRGSETSASIEPPAISTCARRSGNHSGTAGLRLRRHRVDGKGGSGIGHDRELLAFGRHAAISGAPGEIAQARAAVEAGASARRRRSTPPP